MIHIIGHNEIVINLSLFLKERKIDFKVFSNKNQGIPSDNFELVKSKEILKQKLLKAKSNSLILSAGAPWILSDEFLSSFEPTGIFNIHGTLLPNDRGGTIFSWLILNKKRLGNALIHKMTEFIDEGPILIYKEFIYPETCYFPKDFIKIYNENQQNLALELCEKWSSNKSMNFEYFHQPNYLSSYWPRLSSEINSWIDWSMSGNDIELLIRAFDNPYKGALTSWRGKQIFLKKAFFQRDNNFHPYQYGLVYRKRINKEVNYLAIAVSGGSLIVQDCNDSEGNSILNEINEGDRFISNSNDLNEGKTRIIKTNKGLKKQKDL